MIIKHVEMSNSGKENLSHLNYYLKHGRDNLLTEERVQSAFTFNCIGEEPDEVIAEMRATAKLNTRSKKEKFAHFILSLSPGEHITEENWKYCATQLMETLGLKDHQALAYIHKDTDSEHIHLVVNLINPHTLNKNILSYEYKKIGTIAAKLEKELNITEINHAQINSEAERIAQSIETLSGETSFISYMLSFKDELLTCTSWNELHSICKLHNVKIEKTGRGITFTTIVDQNKLTVKASTVDRELSLFKLQEKLGSYQPISDDTENLKPEQSFKQEPTGYSIDKEKIKQLYKLYKEDTKKTRGIKLSLIAKERAQYLANKKQLSDWKRQALKLAYQNFKKDPLKLNQEKERIYRLAQNSQNEIEKIHNKQKRNINQEFKNYNFNDWLRHNKQGSEELSIEALRSRLGAQKQTAINNILGIRSQERKANTLTFFNIKKLTTKGQELFGSSIAKGDLIKDDGNRLLVNFKPSLITVAEMLAMAQARFDSNHPLIVNGTVDFQKQCAIIAIQENINIQFADSKIQKFFTEMRTDQYERYERAERNRLAGLGGRGLDELTARARRISERTIRQFDRFSRITGNAYEIRNGERRTADLSTISELQSLYSTSTLFGESDTTSADFSTERGAKRHFSDFSQTDKRKRSERNQTTSGLHVPNLQSSNMDAAQRHDSVLLHDDQGNFMGKENSQQRVYKDVRWEIPGRRTSSENAGTGRKIEDLITAYLKERNDKHSKGYKDVLEHQLWDHQPGTFEYAGTRNFDNNQYILMKKDNIIYLMQCSEYEIKRLKKLGKGTQLSVTRQGKVQVSRQRKHTI